MNIICSKSQVYSERAILKDFGSFQELYLLKSCRNSGFEIIGEKKNTIKNNDEVKRCSTSRIKRKIREYALMNDFSFFYTQTLKNNRYDLDKFIENIQKKFKAYKRKNKYFIYLIIYEKHQDGAYHLHGLVGGLGDDLYINNNGYYSLKFFEDLGFNSISKIQNKTAISNYILKYVSKDFIKSSKNVSYFHSKGLKLPTTKTVNFYDYSNLNLIFENDYLKKYEVKL